MPNNDHQIYETADLFMEKEIDQDAIQEAMHKILRAVGENPEREGLRAYPGAGRSNVYRAASGLSH